MAVVAYHEKLVDRFVESNPLSKQSFERAKKSLPGGNTRSVLYSDPFPLVIKSGQGALITSVDGRDYVDFLSDYSAGLYGHSNPVIERAVAEAFKSGFSFGGVTEKEAQLSEALKSRFHSIDLIRYTNSGTEANTFALAAATTFTARKKILVFDNGYHGGTLSFHERNNPVNLPHEFVFAPFNDIKGTKSVVSSDLAAILVEPMQSAGGMRVASKEFLSFLREAADSVGAVLIFDEVVTSRFHINGLQAHINVKPDMTTLGKYIGGGFSFGAFGGKEEIMRLFDPSATKKPLGHSGTFNNNVFTMSAAVAASEIVTKEAIEKINVLGERIRNEGNHIFKSSGLDGIKLIGFGSSVGIDVEPGDAILREALYFHLLDGGIQVGRRGFLFLNFAHESSHVDTLLRGFRSFAAEVTQSG